MSFFTAQEQMPAGKGFALFHGQHVAILLLIGGVLACGVWRYRKSVHRNAWRWGIVMTLCLLEGSNICRLTSAAFLFCSVCWKSGNRVPILGSCCIACPCRGRCWHCFSRTGIGCRCGTFSVSIVFYFIRCCCCCLYCCWRTERCNQIGTGCRCRF